MIENPIVKESPTSYSAYQWSQLNCKPVQLRSMDEIIRLSKAYTAPAALGSAVDSKAAEPQTQGGNKHD